MTFEEWQKQISKKAPFVEEGEATKEDETTSKKKLDRISGWPQPNPWSRP
jgi:hypothetical protein